MKASEDFWDSLGMALLILAFMGGIALLTWAAGDDPAPVEQTVVVRDGEVKP